MPATGRFFLPQRVSESGDTAVAKPSRSTVVFVNLQRVESGIDLFALRLGFATVAFLLGFHREVSGLGRCPTFSKFVAPGPQLLRF